MADPFYVGDGLTVFNADLLDALPLLEPGSIDAVVTSPPYAMQRKSTYGGVPEEDYPDWTVAWMDALKPALAECGSVMLNISPHVKGGMLSDYVLRMRLALRADGWYEHDELVWHKKNPMPSGANRRPQRSWESIFWYSRTPKAWADPTRNGQEPKWPVSAHNNGRARRLDWGHHGGVGGKYTNRRSRCQNVFSLATGRDQDTGWDHPAPYPIQLADWLMKINTPDGGTVLDPFAGSGTTSIAALRNGFQSVAIEREAEYAQMIVDRYSAELVKVDNTLELGLTNAES